MKKLPRNPNLAHSKSRYDTFQYLNNKGADQCADVQADLHLCCSQTPKDRYSSFEARMIPIVSLHLNWIGLHAFLEKDV